MPSPLGHVMVGVATAWAGDIAGGRARRSAGRAIDAAGLHGLAIACGLLAAAPDLDFLVHAHRSYTHSIGAALLVGLVAALWAWGRGLPAARIGLLCGLAYASHIPLDWLASSDVRSPGVMALWPWSTAYYKGVGLFGIPEWRIWPLDRFIWKNTLYIVREQILFVPLCAGVWWLRRRTAPAGGSMRRRLRQPHASWLRGGRRAEL